MLYFGWLWDVRRRTWEKVCEVEGMGQCSHRLGEIARVNNVKDRYTALTTGAVPGFRPGHRDHEPGSGLTAP